ncbi:MAG: hypothetical protein KAG06_08395 [Methylococcales bacterium]|nr:hypothetical protein [Methylococcales bacterium]
MAQLKFQKQKSSGGVGRIINHVQSLFVGLLKIWTIPIVLMLSVASGFTTYYGLSHFITDWIALVITVAIQSIIVICSLEIAGIHWKANRLRYFSALLSLLVALSASVSFSYFKFYEISQQDSIHIDRLNEIRVNVRAYLNETIQLKATILRQQRQALEKVGLEVSKAYLGTHPEMTGNYKDQIGEGPIWQHYKDLYDEKKQNNQRLEQEFKTLETHIFKLQQSLTLLDTTTQLEKAYLSFRNNFQMVQGQVNQLSSQFGHSLSSPPLLLSYKELTREVTPSLAMWQSFSLFAFICAAMVDFFTTLLSYRLEFTAPGPLTKEEEELIFECILQFTEFRINKNDELEMVIEKTELEKARRYSDWSRMFAVGLLLNRGFLRKIDERTVEFAPNIYPIIAEKIGEKLMKQKNMRGNDGAK